jgi:hypothetical protein
VASYECLQTSCITRPLLRHACTLIWQIWIYVGAISSLMSEIPYWPALTPVTELIAIVCNPEKTPVDAQRLITTPVATPPRQIMIYSTPHYRTDSETARALMDRSWFLMCIKQPHSEFRTPFTSLSLSARCSVIVLSSFWPTNKHNNP